MRRDKGAGGPPPGPTKYEAKRLAVERGERAPFEFKERTPPSLNHLSQPEPQPLPEIQVKQPGPVLVTEASDAVLPEQIGKIEGRIVKIVVDAGCLFLKTSTGVDIFVGLNKFRCHTRVDPRCGMIVECEVAPHPNGKGPYAVKILSASEPHA